MREALHQHFPNLWPLHSKPREEVFKLVLQPISITVHSLYKHASGTRILLPCFYQVSCKIDQHAFNKADLHRKQCYGTQNLARC